MVIVWNWYVYDTRNANCLMQSNRNRHNEITEGSFCRLQRIQAIQKFAKNSQRISRWILFNKFDLDLHKLIPFFFSHVETSIEYNETYKTVDSKCVKIQCTWNYLMFSIDNVLNISGYVCSEFEQVRSIPFECSIRDLSSCEKFCLILLTSGIVYKVNVHTLETTEINPIIFIRRDQMETLKRGIFGAVAGSDRDFSLNAQNDEFITHIASGRTLSIAVSNRNSVYNIPLKICTFPAHVKIKKVCCGNEHCLILTTNGDVYAFGSSTWVEFEIVCIRRGVSLVCYPYIQQTRTTWTWYAGCRGRTCSCGCIGRHQSESQILQATSFPNEINNLIQIIDIATGGWHSAAISAFNDLYVWGWNVNGQLGLPLYKEIETRDSDGRIKKERQKKSSVFTSPVLLDLPQGSDDGSEAENDPLDSQYNPIEVFAGTRHTIVRNADGTILGSGWNKYRQLGIHHNKDEQDRFVKLKTLNDDYRIMCGEWSSIYFSVK